MFIMSIMDDLLPSNPLSEKLIFGLA